MRKERLAGLMLCSGAPWDVSDVIITSLMYIRLINKGEVNLHYDFSVLTCPQHCCLYQEVGSCFGPGR